MTRRSFLICDLCRREDEVPTAGGWVHVHLQTFGTDDPDVHRDLCPECAPKVHRAVGAS